MRNRLEEHGWILPFGAPPNNRRRGSGRRQGNCSRPPVDDIIPTMAKKTIFVIDDDPMITILLEHILTREGFEVAKAADGREAVDMGQAMNPAPDLVISDHMLPFLSGVELVPILRSLEGWQNVPIIMLTAKGQEADIRRAFDAGADDYLVKPFQPGELLARLRRFVR